MTADPDPLAPFQRRSKVSRVLSILVVLGYVVVGMILDRPMETFKVAVISLIPVLSIWYPGPVSAWFSRLGSNHYYDPSERLIVVLAWIALLVPVWVPVLGLTLLGW